MPKPWTNPRRQQMALQAVMLLILLASIGLAAAVTRLRDRELGVGLGPPVLRGDVRYRLPKDWIPVRSFFQTVPVVAAAAEPAGPDQAERRRVVIYRQKLGIVISPKRYLVESELPTIPGGEFAGITMAGQTGALYQAQGVEVIDGRQLEVKELLACAVLPSGQAITIHLQGPGAITTSDLALIRQMADAIATPGDGSRDDKTRSGDEQSPKKTNLRDKPNV